MTWRSVCPCLARKACPELAVQGGRWPIEVVWPSSIFRWSLLLPWDSRALLTYVISAVTIPNHWIQFMDMYRQPLSVLIRYLALSGDLNEGIPFRVAWAWLRHPLLPSVHPVSYPWPRPHSRVVIRCTRSASLGRRGFYCRWMTHLCQLDLPWVPHRVALMARIPTMR